jgi:secreted trypsin-like serine protease
VTGDPAIMAMLSFKGAQGARCTATLITPRLLIAAAHCITETPGFVERQIFPVNNDRNGAAPEMLAIKTVVTNPAYGVPRQGNDFCIIVLEAPLAIPPMRLNRASLAGAQGKTVRYVGYGIAVVGNLGSGGVKRQNVVPLAGVSNLLLTVAANANQSCEGDSGGPMLLDRGDGQGEAIIGINSFVDAPACRNNSYFQRVDTQLPWIDEQIKKYDPDGMLPPTDAGAVDAQRPGSPDAAPEAPSVQPEVMPNPPVTPADAQSPGTGGSPAPPRDAGSAPRAPDVSTQPGPTAAAPIETATGCRFGGSAPPAGSKGGAVAVVVLFAWAARRHRRRPG